MIHHSLLAELTGRMMGLAKLIVLAMSLGAAPNHKIESAFNAIPR